MFLNYIGNTVHSKALGGRVAILIYMFMLIIIYNIDNITGNVKLQDYQIHTIDRSGYIPCKIPDTKLRVLNIIIFAIFFQYYHFDYPERSMVRNEI